MASKPETINFITHGDYIALLVLYITLFIVLILAVLNRELLLRWCSYFGGTHSLELSRHTVDEESSSETSSVDIRLISGENNQTTEV